MFGLAFLWRLEVQLFSGDFNWYQDFCQSVNDVKVTFCIDLDAFDAVRKLKLHDVLKFLKPLLSFIRRS